MMLFELVLLFSDRSTANLQWKPCSTS